MAAHQAPPSLGFSRQEHWSGVPFPSPMHESEKWKWNRAVVYDSSRPHGLQPTRLLRPWDFPGKSTGVGCHCLLRPGGASSKEPACKCRKGNKVYKTAKKVALELGTWPLLLTPRKPDPSNYSPVHIKEGLDKAQRGGFCRDWGGQMWLVNERGEYWSPQTAVCQAIREAHQGAHHRREALCNWLVEVMVTPGMKSTVR